jgi:hypothetical protein
MTIYREQRGSCLIEAGALDLHNGNHWQPWLRLTRRTGGVCTSDTFDRLMPVFGTEPAALRYAAELGRSLIDEASAVDPALRSRNPRTWPLNQALGRPGTYRFRSLAFLFANLMLPA